MFSFKGYFKYSKLRIFNEISELNIRFPKKFALFHDNLLVLDVFESAMIEFDRNFKLIDKHKINDLIQNEIMFIDRPMEMCTNRLNQVIIYNEPSKLNEMLYIFDENLIFMKRIKCTSYARYMKADNVKPHYLYILTRYAHEMHLIDILKEETIKIVKVSHPLDLYDNFDRIFITCDTYYYYSDSKTMCQIKPCSNRITVLNKVTLEYITMIYFKEWMHPKGIFVDRFDNIWTTAFKIFDNQSHSQYRYLFIINSSGYIIKELYLYNIDWISDLMVFHNKLILCDASKIHVYELQ